MSGDGNWFSPLHIRAWRRFFRPKEEIPEVKKQIHLKIGGDEKIQTDNQTSMLMLTQEDSTIVLSSDSNVVYKDKKRLEEYTSGDGFTAYNAPYPHCEELKHEAMKSWMTLDSEEKKIRRETSKILILDPPEINHAQPNTPEFYIDENILKQTVKERIDEFDQSPGLYTHHSKDDKVFFMNVSY